MGQKKQAKDGLNRCPHCGSTDIVLSIIDGKLKCQMCRTLFLPQKAEKGEDVRVLINEYIGKGSKRIIPEAKDILTIKCTACGAEVVIDTTEAPHARCHWCRHSLLVNNAVANGAVPDAILPFALEKKKAELKIQNFVKKRQFFAHPKFKKEFTAKNVMGVYLPYMMVDVNGKVELKGQGEHLVKKYTRRVQGKQQKTYYDADLYAIERKFDLLIDDLTMEASRDKLNQNALINTNNIINSIMPFDTENCTSWNANYLKGFASEKRNINVADLRSQMELQAKDIARFRANASLGFYDRGIKWDSENLKLKGARWRSAYLPVWLYSYMQEMKGKKLLHYCAVNARSGEIMGSVPVNKKKLFIAALIVELIGIFLGTAWILRCLDTTDDAFLIGLLGYTPGFIYYWVIKNRYRNMAARHYHEKETKVEIENLKKIDTFIDHRKELSNARMAGANNMEVKGALSKGAGKLMAQKLTENLSVSKRIDKAEK